MKLNKKNSVKYMAAAGTLALVLAGASLQPLAAADTTSAQTEKSGAADLLNQKIEDFSEQFANGVKNSKDLQKVIQKAVEIAKTPNHTVKPTGAPEYRFGYTESFLNAIRSGSSRLYFASGANTEADYSLGEVVYDYCGLASGGAYYTGQDGNGFFLEIVPGDFQALSAAVASSDAQWAAYSGQVADAVKTLNLKCSDRELVDQINQYIVDNYDYVLTNQANMPNFMATHQGQCWHYAKLFADMCNSVGIPAAKVENPQHAWDTVTVDGTTYTFDPTFNDLEGNPTAYTWQ